MSIKTEVSVGEFLDKLTILQIKNRKISDPVKLLNVRKEMALLQEMWASSSFAKTDVEEEIRQLTDINEALWDIEDNIRDKEQRGDFGAQFVQLARSVYINNDKRADIKRRINLKTGSELVEEKSYNNK
jgi:hypothetical protein